MGVSVNVNTAALILLRCKKLTTLTIHFTYRHISCSVKNPMYLPLLELKDLQYLYIGLTALYTKHIVILPKIEFIKYPTHIHLSSSRAASISIPRGFAGLANLTHLSMSWAIGRSCTSDLREFLQKSSSVVLIQWYDEHHSLSDVKTNLINRGLVDQRIVVLGTSLLMYHENNQTIWLFAQRIVQWRSVNKGKNTHLGLIPDDP